MDEPMIVRSLMYSHFKNGTGVKYFSQMKKAGNNRKPITIIAMI